VPPITKFPATEINADLPALMNLKGYQSEIPIPEKANIEIIPSGMKITVISPYAK